MQTEFSVQTASVLVENLPHLLAPEASSSTWLQQPQVQAYFNFYGINFTQNFADVKHKFGYMDCAGFRIAVQRWSPLKARGTLVVVHGYYDHMGLYGKLIAHALAQNLAVLAFDLPGHGLSSGERVSIASFDRYTQVLDQVLAQLEGQLLAPLYGVGQSTGGAIWLDYLWSYEQPRQVNKKFARVAVFSPLVLPRGWHLGQFLYLLVKPFLRRMPRGPSHSSHDAEFNNFVDTQDPLQTHYLSVDWVGAMKAWDKKFRGYLPIDTPLLVVQGTEDLTVRWRYNLALIKMRLPNARISLLAGAGHQLVNESEHFRRDMFAQLDTYFFNEKS
jgi:alpha-beta hydrolase superfamily lysophospholipase